MFDEFGIFFSLFLFFFSITVFILIKIFYSIQAKNHSIVALFHEQFYVRNLVKWFSCDLHLVIIQRSLQFCLVCVCVCENWTFSYYNVITLKIRFYLFPGSALLDWWRLSLCSASISNKISLTSRSLKVTAVAAAAASAAIIINHLIKSLWISSMLQNFFKA